METLHTLRAEHRQMKHLLELLERQVALFARTERPDYELMREILDYFLTFPDLYHHPKEDIVFSCLKAHHPDRAAAVGDLEHEHENLSERLHRFSRAVINVMLDADVPREAFVEAAEQFIEGERKHMQIEETRFFPVVAESLSAEEWAQIDEKTTPFRDRLSGSEVAQRFALLRNVLQRWHSEGRA